MEPFEDTESCSCGWGDDGCRVKSITEELGHVVLAFLTMTKIKADFVDTMVVDDQEGIVFCWMGYIASISRRMAKLYA
jgi:hypothetical protein